MSSPRRNKFSNALWEEHKSVIRRLYIEEKKTLGGDNGVIEYMKVNHEFCASKAQYENRFRKWNVRKNITREQWQAIGLKMKDARHTGLPSQVFMHKEIIPNHKVNREVARYRIGDRPLDLNNDPLEGISVPELLSQPQLLDISDDIMPAATVQENGAGSEMTSAYPLAASSMNMNDNSRILDSSGNTISRTISPDSLHGNSFAGMNFELATENLSYFSPRCRSVNLSSLTDDSDIVFMPWTINNFPKSSLSFFNGMDISGLRATSDADERLSRVAKVSLASLGSVLPLETHQELQLKSYDAVFFTTIMFVLMNNLAGVEDVAIENLFRQLVRLSITQMVRILDAVPSPFVGALQQSILTIAIKLGVTAIVETLLQRGIDINRIRCIHEECALEPLELACMFFQLEIVSTLLNAGAIVNNLNGLGSSAIIRLLLVTSRLWRKIEIPRSALKIFKLLLQAHAKVGWAELACHVFWSNDNNNNNNNAWLDTFLQYGTTPVPVTDTGRDGPYISMVLNYASTFAENARVTRVIIALLGRQFRFIKQRNSLSTGIQGMLERCFRIYCTRNNVEMMVFLLQSGFTPNVRTLIEAMRASNLVAVNLLRQAGTELDAALKVTHGFVPEGLDALSYAGILPNGHDSLLLDNGLRWTWEIHNTPFAEAIRNKDADLMEIFCGCDIMAGMGDDRRFNAALTAAAESGDAGMIKTLINIRPRLNKKHSMAIFLATLGGHEDIVLMLMSAGCPARSDSLLAAAMIRHPTLLRCYLDAGTAAVFPEVLVAAIRWGSIEMIKDLMMAGVVREEVRSPELQEPNHKTLKETPLCVAIAEGNQQVIEILIENGPGIININAEETRLFRSSALMKAASMGNEWLVRKLLSRGAEPNDSVALAEAACHSNQMMQLILHAFDRQYPRGKRYFASYALRKAIREENIEQVNLLVKYTDLNDSDRSLGNYDKDMLFHLEAEAEYLLTPLGQAILGQNSSIIQQILAHGGDPKSTVHKHLSDPHRGRWVALHLAVYTKNLDTVRMVCYAGAEINCDAALRITRTPLQLAVEMGNISVVEFLLERGAQVNARPCIWAGGTALQLAATKGFVGCAELLLKHGADVNAERGRFGGRTAFEGAAEHGRMDMLLLLHHHNVDLVSDGGEQVRRAMSFAEENGQLAAKSLVQELARSVDTWLWGNLPTPIMS